MRCGYFKQEAQAMAVVDRDGLHCGVRFPKGLQKQFDAAYERWTRRRNLPRGNFNLRFGKNAEERE